MQRLFSIAPGANHAVELDPARLDEARSRGWVWVDMVGVDLDELVRLRRVFDLDRYALEEVTRDTAFPTIEAYGAHTFVVGHSISSDERSLRLVEFDAFIGEDFLLTIQHESLPGFDWAHDHVLTPGTLDGVTPDRLMSRIAEAGSVRFQPLVSHLDERIIDLEDRAIDADPTVAVEVQALRRDVLTVRRGVAPQREIYRALERGGMPAIGDRSRLRFGSVADNFERLTDEVDGARALLSGVLDTYRSAVAERANEVMKVLTVFAAIVLPMSLMAGIYGMNFSNMPELAWPWAYFALLGAMASVGLGLWIYFARRGFIGGPRLSTIPRGVGRGLAGIVEVTVKPTLKLIALLPGMAGSPADDDDVPEV